MFIWSNKISSFKIKECYCKYSKLYFIFVVLVQGQNVEWNIYAIFLKKTMKSMNDELRVKKAVLKLIS